MPSDRLLTHLLAELEQPETRKTLLQTTQDWLKRGLYSRVFGSLNGETDARESAQYHALFYRKPLIGDLELRTVNRAEAKHGERFEFEKSDDIQRVLRFVNIMVSRACNDLLDEHGHIRRELIYLLGWSDFRETLLLDDVKAHIVHSYVEALIGGLCKTLLASVSPQDQVAIMDVLGAVTAEAGASYMGYIIANLTARRHPNALDDSVIQFMAAMYPDATPRRALEAWIQGDLEKSAGNPALRQAYIAFWVQVMLEGLGRHRLDITVVVMNALAAREVKTESLSGTLQSSWRFCQSQIKAQSSREKYATRVSEDKERESVSTAAQDILDLRDVHIAKKAALVAPQHPVSPKVKTISLWRHKIKSSEHPAAAASQPPSPRKK